MTVKITKPSINVREELADLKKPTGLAGEAMLRAETPQEQFQLIGAGRRNLIINGGFTVWQRSTSGVAASSFNMDAADRWYSSRAALSQEIENSMPYAHLVHGNYSDSAYINHRIEDFAHTLGKEVTLSFWIKSDDGLGSDGAIFIRYYNSSNAYVTVVPSTTSFTYSTGWKKITHTFTMPTTTPKGAGYGLEFFLYGDKTSTNNNGKSWDMKEVQFELGKVATPFEHRSYREELAACQRYYEKTYNQSVVPATATAIGGVSTGGVAGNNTTSEIGSRFNFEVSKRAVPTVTIYDLSGNVGKVTRGLYGTGTTANQTGATANIAETGVFITSASGSDASEFYAHYTADAEL